MSALDPHHRKLRAQGGDDSWGNQIELPRDVHDLIHANPEVAYQHGMLVREHEEPGAIKPDLRGFLASVGYEGEPGAAAEKPKRQRLPAGERRQRATISVKVPQDVREDGAGIWDDLVGDGKDDRPYGRVRERLNALGADGDRAPYYVIVDALNDWLNS